MIGIGEAFKRSWWVRIAALAIGLGVVAYDLFVPGSNEQRSSIGVLTLALFLVLARGDRHAVGLVMPRPNLRWWLRATAIAGFIFGVVVFGAVWVLYATGHLRDVGRTPLPVDEFLWQACVIAPLVEEPVYRLALCAPLVAVVGRWPTIIASGAVFAFLHFQYGVLSPDNALAGLLLGWAYLRSGSLAVPLVLHAAGNAVVVAFNYVIWPML